MKILEIIIAGLVWAISIILLVYIFAFSLIAAFFISIIIGAILMMLMIFGKLKSRKIIVTSRKTRHGKNGMIIDAEYEVIEEKSDNEK